MSRSISKRLVVVTGASRGLGAALALEFARRDARLALIARDQSRLEEVAKDARQLGAAVLVAAAELRDLSAVERVFGLIASKCGPVDVLVNAAGMKVEGLAESADLAKAMEAMEVNYLGPLACCKAVIPDMRRRGAGHIINVSSVLGKRATPGRGAYSASKAALNAWSDSLRVELMGTGVCVTLVCPGRFAAESQAASLLRITPEKAARKIADCVGSKKRELLLTPAGWALSALNAFSPRLVDSLLSGWRRREASVTAGARGSDLDGSRS